MSGSDHTGEDEVHQICSVDPEAAAAGSATATGTCVGAMANVNAGVKLRQSLYDATVGRCPEEASHFQNRHNGYSDSWSRWQSSHSLGNRERERVDNTSTTASSRRGGASVVGGGGEGVSR
ncbi:unnamed protein product [Amoebophrya sp. A120]|nr:unnamed protein product [Amoebophrya sp. A120]|eukprot:GSA120T00023001001.1